MVDNNENFDEEVYKETGAELSSTDPSSTTCVMDNESPTVVDNGNENIEGVVDQDGRSESILTTNVTTGMSVHTETGDTNFLGESADPMEMKSPAKNTSPTPDDVVAEYNVNNCIGVLHTDF